MASRDEAPKEQEPLQYAVMPNASVRKAILWSLNFQFLVLVGVVVCAVLIMNELNGCAECTHGSNDICHVVVMPYDLRGPGIEVVNYEGPSASLDVPLGTSGVKYDPRLSPDVRPVMLSGARVVNAECPLLLSAAQPTGFDNSTHFVIRQLTEGLPPLDIDICSEEQEGDATQRATFEKTESISQLQPMFYNSALAVYGVMRFLLWCANKSWYMSSGYHNPPMNRCLSLCLQLVRFACFSTVPAACIAPLSSLVLHEDCPNVVAMTVDKELWKWSIYAGPIIGILLWGSVWGWCGIICLVPFSLAAAMLGCLWLVFMYLQSYLPVDLPGLPIFGFDFRLLFTFQMKYNITLRASVLRPLMFLILVLDVIDEVLKNLVRVSKKFRDDGTVRKMLFPHTQIQRFRKEKRKRRTKKQRR